MVWLVSDTTPPMCVLKDTSQSLIEANLAPMCLVYVGSDKQTGKYWLCYILQFNSDTKYLPKLDISTLPPPTDHVPDKYIIILKLFFPRPDASPTEGGALGTLGQSITPCLDASPTGGGTLGTGMVNHSMSWCISYWGRDTRYPGEVNHSISWCISYWGRGIRYPGAVNHSMSWCISYWLRDTKYTGVVNHSTSWCISYWGRDTWYMEQ